MCIHHRNHRAGGGHGVNFATFSQGDEKIEGLTDQTVPRRLAPKRATKIRKLFNLTKEDDVRKYVIRRVLPEKTAGDKTKKERSKAPKIQRLVCPFFALFSSPFCRPTDEVNETSPKRTEGCRVTEAKCPFSCGRSLRSRRGAPSRRSGSTV